MRKTYAAVMLLNHFATGLMVPVLSLVLLNKGCSMSQLAFAIGAYSLSAFMLELPSGIFADRCGRKRSFLLSCLTGCISIAILLLFRGFAVTMLAMSLNGCARAFSSGSMDALLIDRSLLENGPEKLASVTTQLSLMETIGVAAGSALGGVLPSVLQNFFPAHLYDANLVVRIAVSVCAALLALRFVEETPAKTVQPELREDSEIPKIAESSKLQEAELLQPVPIIKEVHTAQEQNRPATLRQYMNEGIAFVRHNPVVLLLTVGGLLTGFFFGTVETYWQPFFTALLPGSTLLWLLGLLAFGSMGFALLGNVAMKRTLDSGRVTQSKGYTGMRIGMGAFLFLLALSKAPAGFGVWYLIMYFCLGAANIAESVLLNREISSEHRSGMLSFFSLVTQAGVLLSTGVAGVVVAFRGVAELWIWEGLALLILSAGIGILLKKALRVSKTELIH